MSSAQSHKKILVVDDSPAELKLLTQLLEHEGYQAIGVDDPTKIEQTIDADRPGLILLDVVMPVRNGFEACRELKASAEYGAIPVIIVTTKATQSDRHWGELQGANGYVFKPFRREDLMRAVRRFA
jgi:DNA-binding response OmpR family regulator